MHEVWGYDCNGRVRTVDVHVRRLRAKLGAGHESMVDTVRGVGYMAVTPPQPQWIHQRADAESDVDIDGAHRARFHRAMSFASS